MNKTEETCSAVTGESEKKEFVLELVDDNMDIEVDESTGCILEDVLLIDSEDCIDEDTIPIAEADNCSAKQNGIDILLIMLFIFIISVCFITF